MSKGVVIDDFMIIKLLGDGGMGNVYLAHQFSLDRNVALKILKDEISQNEEIRNSFIREARSVASLNHSNIIQAFKVGIEDDILFFAMEYVQGPNLYNLLEKENQLDEVKVLSVGYDIAKAIGYAWSKRKLVHRDIKPENIMISNDEGLTKLMDLGLSCYAQEQSDDGKISGTPQYISPEQILGNEVDFRTDFYSLGATLYHLLSGQFPFDGTLREIIRQHIQDIPPSLKRVRPELSENTIKIINKLMNKKPEDRYSSADKLMKDLKHTKKLILDNEKGKKHFSYNSASGAKQSSNSNKKRRKKVETQQLKVYFILGLILLVTFGSIIFLNRETDKTNTNNLNAKVVNYVEIF